VAAAKKRRKPVVDKQARKSIEAILTVLEELVDRDQIATEDRQRLWNSVMSAWVSIEHLEDAGKLAKEGRKLEKELGVK